MAYGVSIDLDAVPCVDVGHHWQITFTGRAPSGPWKGAPVRASVCGQCHSAKVERLTWNGKVQARMYDHDESYIVHARMLGDFGQRRQNLRAAILRRVKKEGNVGYWPGDDQ